MFFLFQHFSADDKLLGFDTACFYWLKTCGCQLPKSLMHCGTQQVSTEIYNWTNFWINSCLRLTKRKENNHSHIRAPTPPQSHILLILIDKETLRSRKDQIILALHAPLPPALYLPCTHTHTHLLHHRQPLPIRLPLSAAPCCSCFERSELFVCSEAQRLIACVGLRLPLLPHLNLSRYQPTPPATPTLSFKRNTSPGNYGEILCVCLSVMVETSGQTGTIRQIPCTPGSNPSYDPWFPCQALSTQDSLLFN